MPTDLNIVVPMFRRDWRKAYGRLPPLGWELRQSGTVPWIRFHALPRSKRYAETPSERATILSRAQSLGDAILEPNGQCWLVEANPAEPDREAVPVAEHVEAESDSHLWRFYARAVIWHPAAFEPLLLDIAEERVAPTLWMSRRTGAVFAPYDGGFDLFPPNAKEVAHLKRQHAGWLSPYPEGL